MPYTQLAGDPLVAASAAYSTREVAVSLIDLSMFRSWHVFLTYLQHDVRRRHALFQGGPSMDTKQNFGSSFDRRSFLQRSAALGVGALGLESFLAACRSSPPPPLLLVNATAHPIPP